MKKILGVLGLLIAICVYTTIVNPRFLGPDNIENLIRRTSLFGIISIGAAFVIITSGIDLSIGSLIALTGCLLALFLAPDYQLSTDQYTVVAVDGSQRAVSFSSDSMNVKKGDKLRIPDDSSSRNLTVESARQSGGITVVTVFEPPRFVRKNMKLVAAHARHMNVFLAVGLVLLISLGIGVLHGLLITRIALQPFVVTLCGLLFYRGYVRYLTNDRTQGFGSGFEGLKYLAKGRPFSIPVPFLNWISDGNWSSHKWDFDTGQQILDGVGNPMPLDVVAWIAIPMPAIILIVIAIASAVLLNYSIFGRYLLALGRNEQAARYSGINTKRMIVMAYVICAFLSGIVGILFAVDLNAIQPNSHGNFYELYAIAAAVLGGCSLRGGEGSILGVLIGAAVMRVLYNAINLTGIPTQLEFAIIGAVILAGVIADEMFKRYAARRRATQQAARAEKEAGGAEIQARRASE